MEKEQFIKTNELDTYVRIFEASKHAENIIFIMTPIGTVKSQITDNFLQGLTGKTCNVFALDFNGIGNSKGTARDISIETMKQSLVSLINYISQNYNEQIHFYGGTGTGGILAQALCGYPEIGSRIKSLIQFGLGIYKDSTIMGKSSTLNISYRIMKLMNVFMPGKRIGFKVPFYDGPYAEKENKWYADVIKQDSKAFDFKLSLFTTLLGLFFNKKSPLQIHVNVPTLVLAAQHDRYYYKEYVERYFNMLECQKELYWIEGSHTCFDWKAEEINARILEWIRTL